MRRSIAFLLALLLMLGTVPFTAMATKIDDSEQLVIKLHYNRPDLQVYLQRISIDPDGV